MAGDQTKDDGAGEDIDGDLDIHVPAHVATVETALP